MVHVDLDEIDPDRQDTSSCGGTDDSIGDVSNLFCTIFKYTRFGCEYHYCCPIINKVFFVLVPYNSQLAVVRIIWAEFKGPLHTCS